MRSRPRLPAVERLAESQIHVVAPAAGGAPGTTSVVKFNSTFVAAQYGHRIARVAVFGMPGQFDADLIVTIAEVVGAARDVEVIDLIDSAVVRKEQEPLFRNHVVEFEPAEPQVQPRTPFRLSNRTQAASKCHTAVESEDGNNTNEMFL